MPEPKSVADYIAALPPDRKKTVQALRKAIKANLGKGYAEGIQYGMIGYFVPHSVYPAGYHCDPKQPVPFAAIGSQKNYVAVYLMGVYGDAALADWFRSAWKETGKRLDMGKSCVRIKRIEDAALDVIGEAIRRVPLSTYLERYQSLLKGRAPRRKR